MKAVVKNVIVDTNVMCRSIAASVNDMGKRRYKIDFVWNLVEAVQNFDQGWPVWPPGGSTWTWKKIVSNKLCFTLEVWLNNIKKYENNFGILNKCSHMQDSDKT